MDIEALARIESILEEVAANLAGGGMSADTFRKLAALGLTTEQIAGVLEIMDGETEKRREKGRERWHRWKDKQLANVSQRLQTTANDSRKGARVEDNLQTKELAGQKKEERKEDARKRAFSDFWAIFPNKVGKRDAETAFLKALTRADIETILEGVRRYAAKTDDRPWCNPATFLNQDRWADMPAAQPMRQATAPPRREDPFQALAEIQDARNGQSFSSPDRQDAQRLPSVDGEREGVVVDLRRGAGGYS